jgi:23S rRNA (uracil1939-C5)-methyltransferase
MKAWVKDHCTVAGQSVLELFAGSGNFTEPLSRLGATVLAVELQEEAVRKLKSFESVVVYERNLFHQKDVETLASELPDYSVLFLDPPREGCPHLKSFLLPKLQQVYYVSCDLESFVRDAKQLQRASFVLQSVQPVDMFPQTPHIELLAKFQR